MKVTGSFAIEPALQPHHNAYLQRFAGLRRYIWDTEKLVDYPDPLRRAVGLPFGDGGLYFVGPSTASSRDETFEDYPGELLDWVEDLNPFSYLPNGHCQWIPSDDGTRLEWIGSEELSNWEDWVPFMIEHFFRPWGYTLSGEVYIEVVAQEHLCKGTFRLEQDEMVFDMKERIRLV